MNVAYNQFTQFEEWPKFMHRVQSVSQEDETHLKFKTKIWLFSREFTAEIEEQRPDERILWNVTEGITHTRRRDVPRDRPAAHPRRDQRRRRSRAA